MTRKYVCTECEWSIPADEYPDSEAINGLLQHYRETKHTPIGTIEALRKPLPKVSLSHCF